LSYNIDQIELLTSITTTLTLFPNKFNFTGGTKNGTTQTKRFVMMRIKWRMGWENPIDYNELREKGSLK